MKYSYSLPFVFVIAAACAIGACGGASSPAGDDGDTLPPPADSSLSAKAQLGDQIFHDAALSASGLQSCQSCHDPGHAFAAADDAPVPLGGPDVDLPGLRNAPSLMYASYTPAFGTQDDGTGILIQVGGFFRDGRAPTLAAQAEQPFLTSFELANADSAEVMARLQTRPYANQFKQVFGAAALSDADLTLQYIGEALASYEMESPEFHPFTSKFDYWLRGQAQLSTQELEGYGDFTELGGCADCHTNQARTPGVAALFTDFSYEAIGAPRNPSISANDDTTTLDYVPANSSDGVHRYYDLGLCGPFRGDLSNSSGLCGMFKTPTLRNVAVTAPYFHNGVFATLQDVMAFYNTRDTQPDRWYPIVADGSVTKFDDIPLLDGGMFVVNINTPGSDLNYVGPVDTSELPYNRHIGEAPLLNDAQIKAIIAFMCTLTDGYDPNNPSAYALPAQCQQAEGSGQ